MHEGPGSRRQLGEWPFDKACTNEYKLKGFARTRFVLLARHIGREARPSMQETRGPRELRDARLLGTKEPQLNSDPAAREKETTNMQKFQRLFMSRQELY